MTRYLSLANLISGLPSLFDRLTTLVRRRDGDHARSRLHLQSSQSPPRRQNSTGRQSRWAYRIRIESVRPETLSAHLRRAIGLDL